MDVGSGVRAGAALTAIGRGPPPRHRGSGTSGPRVGLSGSGTVGSLLPFGRRPPLLALDDPAAAAGHAPPLAGHLRGRGPAPVEAGPRSFPWLSAPVVPGRGATVGTTGSSSIATRPGLRSGAPWPFRACRTAAGRLPASAGTTPGRAALGRPSGRAASSGGAFAAVVGAFRHRGDGSAALSCGLHARQAETRSGRGEVLRVGLRRGVRVVARRVLHRDAQREARDLQDAMN